MTKSKMRKNKRGQITTSDSAPRQMLKWGMALLTGAGGVQAPMSLRYLLVGDSAMIGRIRRNCQLEKSIRNHLEHDLEELTRMTKNLRNARPEEKEKQSVTIIEKMAEFSNMYKKDFILLEEIGKNDASLLAELMTYYKVVGKFLNKIISEGFPKEAAMRVFGNLRVLSEEFDQDATEILGTAQSEYRGTVNIGRYSYKSSDTLDNLIRRIARMLDNVHRQIIAETNTLSDLDKKADVKGVQEHINSMIALMHSELQLIKAIIDDDQVLINRIIEANDKFTKQAFIIAQSVTPGKRAVVSRIASENQHFMDNELANFKAVAQQLKMHTNELKNQVN